MTDSEKAMLNNLEKRIVEIGVSNEFLIENIKLNIQYLGLKTIMQYKKLYHKTYRGVKNHRKIVNLFGKNFVIDND